MGASERRAPAARRERRTPSRRLPLHRMPVPVPAVPHRLGRRSSSPTGQRRAPDAGHVGLVGRVVHLRAVSPLTGPTGCSSRDEPESPEAARTVCPWVAAWANNDGLRRPHRSGPYRPRTRPNSSRALWPRQHPPWLRTCRSVRSRPADPCRRAPTTRAQAPPPSRCPAQPPRPAGRWRRRRPGRRCTGTSEPEATLVGLDVTRRRRARARRCRPSGPRPNGPGRRGSRGHRSRPTGSRSTPPTGVPRELAAGHGGRPTWSGRHRTADRGGRRAGAGVRRGAGRSADGLDQAC